MRLRNRIFTLLTAILSAVVSSVVLAAPPSQAAHKIIKGALGSVVYNQCLWAPASLSGALYTDACSGQGNTRAKWNIHYVSENWEGYGNDMVVLESIQYPGKCLVLPGQGSAYLGTCNWTTEANYNTFEAFYAGYLLNGNPVYQMKSTTLWRQGQRNRCLGGGGNTPVVTWECNNTLKLTYWTQSAVL
ncbi:hypothetical protein [Actinoplanes sp. NPDC051494]|uniref:hypothetical protein n=1 Tax=Actinoplanes sp. NPDC051494 TaxID=3363907 RepID=UPI003788A581